VHRRSKIQGESEKLIVAKYDTRPCETGLRVSNFADNLDIVGNSLEDAANATNLLGNGVTKISLQIKGVKTKIIEMLENDKNVEIWNS